MFAGNVMSGEDRSVSLSDASVEDTLGVTGWADKYLSEDECGILSAEDIRWSDGKVQVSGGKTQLSDE